MGTQVVAAMTVIRPQQRSLKTIVKNVDFQFIIYDLWSCSSAWNFVQKGEGVLQLCYATMLQHNHKCITTLWFHFSSTPTGASTWSSSEPSRSGGGRWRLFWVRRWWWWSFLLSEKRMKNDYEDIDYTDDNDINWMLYFPSDVTFEPTHPLIKSPGGITWVYR